MNESVTMMVTYHMPCHQFVVDWPGLVWSDVVVKYKYLCSALVDVFGFYYLYIQTCSHFTICTKVTRECHQIRIFPYDVRCTMYSNRNSLNIYRTQ